MPIQYTGYVKKKDSIYILNKDWITGPANTCNYVPLINGTSNEKDANC